MEQQGGGGGGWGKQRGGGGGGVQGSVQRVWSRGLTCLDQPDRELSPRRSMWRGSK